MLYAYTSYKYFYFCYIILEGVTSYRRNRHPIP